MRIHPIAPDLPQECIAIHAQVFMGIQFHTTHDVSSYEDWIERDSQHLAYDLLVHAELAGPGVRLPPAALPALADAPRGPALGPNGARALVQLGRAAPPLSE